MMMTIMLAAATLLPPPNPVQLTRKAPSLRAVPEFQLVEAVGRG